MCAQTPLHEFMQAQSCMNPIVQTRTGTLPHRGPFAVITQHTHTHSLSLFSSVQNRTAVSQL
jgi:hypothetical protein